MFLPKTAQADIPFVCSENTPWAPSMGTPVVHPDAHKLGSYDDWRGTEVVAYKCPHCGHQWATELPQ